MASFLHSHAHHILSCLKVLALWQWCRKPVTVNFNMCRAYRWPFRPNLCPSQPTGKQLPCTPAPLHCHAVGCYLVGKCSDAILNRNITALVHCKGLSLSQQAAGCNPEQSAKLHA